MFSVHKNSVRIFKNAISSIKFDACESLLVLDIGSRITPAEQPCYANFFHPPEFDYVGVDLEVGPNVDLVVADPYNWSEIVSKKADLVISGQALEHMPLFWLAIQEMFRVLKHGGHLILIVPSKGAIHRFPVDCFRFLPDGLTAAVEWAGFEVLKVEHDPGSYWGDLVVTARRPSENSSNKVIASYTLKRVSRSRRIPDVLISVLAALIGDIFFMKLVGVRDKLKKSR